MQTEFTPEQLLDSDTAQTEKILRACVHCGFCTATCPTYVLLGDELDSPRGRIYLVKNMLETGAAPGPETVKHIDRCLSCLGCMTTCPSGVNYMHLIDHARRYIEEHHHRPWIDRVLRRLLGVVLSRPKLFRLALLGAGFAKFLAPVVPRRLRPMLALAPRSVPSPSASDRPQIFPAEGPTRMRVALLSGCAQQVLKPEINEATIRLLTRHGCEIVVAEGSGCCGSLTHHLGQEDAALAFARANIDAWERLRRTGGLDAIVVNASGCGTTVKDYGFMLRDDPAYADKAARVSALARDVSEVVAELGLRPGSGAGRVAYHSACSLQHGQKVHRLPKELLAAAGFEPVDIPEGHLCCGSAGTYNLLQPELAGRLRDRKLANIARTAPDFIAAGNIGCITQLAAGSAVPVLHTVELLDWATGGPMPPALAAAAR
ncbi:MAG TPA: glycolate oxidase subunit GlcF [Stellaceae bacterium]|jgi:glycolate oxidase iron-sulfur subunit|nr:glycolate oxidase subunit GlcF [Stellaceae bacterium]